MCTNLSVTAQDGSVIVGRTMDLNLDLQSHLLIFPAGMSFTSRAPKGAGHHWKGTYGFVGMNGKNVQMVADGLNQAGLYGGALYLPGFTEYQEVDAEEAAHAIAPVDVVMYVLSTAATVAEAKTAIKKVKVWSEVTPEVGFVFPLHFVFHDPSGACVVFEYVEGELHIHDNALGVLTNAPTFDWHLTNLGNFVNLTPNDAFGENLGSVPVKQLGEGSGMLGLPGDFTPPSRFVRAVALTRTALPSPNAAATTTSALHIMNNFDLVLGVERNTRVKQQNCDYTQWTTLSDLANGYCYIRMHDQPGYGRVTLKDLDFSASGVRTIAPTQLSWFTDLL